MSWPSPALCLAQRSQLRGRHPGNRARALGRRLETAISAHRLAARSPASPAPSPASRSRPGTASPWNRTGGVRHRRAGQPAALGVPGDKLPACNTRWMIPTNIATKPSWWWARAMPRLKCRGAHAPNQVFTSTAAMSSPRQGWQPLRDHQGHRRQPDNLLLSLGLHAVEEARRHRKAICAGVEYGSGEARIACNRIIARIGATPRAVCRILRHRFSGPRSHGAAGAVPRYESKCRGSS